MRRQLGAGVIDHRPHLALRVGQQLACVVARAPPQVEAVDVVVAEFPAFAQTTVSRLALDLQALREQGFKLAVIDTPPAITMAIQSVISVAELIVVPTRPSPHDLRAVGATVDLCERAGVTTWIPAASDDRLGLLHKPKRDR